MTEKKTVTEKKPEGKTWNFPHAGVSIFAKTFQEAKKLLADLQKKTTNPSKS